MPEIGKIIISIEIQGYDEAMEKLDQLQKKVEFLSKIETINMKLEKIAKDKCNEECFYYNSCTLKITNNGVKCLRFKAKETKELEKNSCYECKFRTYKQVTHSSYENYCTKKQHMLVDDSIAYDNYVCEDFVKKTN